MLDEPWLFLVCKTPFVVEREARLVRWKKTRRALQLPISSNKSWKEVGIDGWNGGVKRQ
jgi:hypothetical protein